MSTSDIRTTTDYGHNPGDVPPSYDGDAREYQRRRRIATVVLAATLVGIPGLAKVAEWRVDPQPAESSSVDTAPSNTQTP